MCICNARFTQQCNKYTSLKICARINQQTGTQAVQVYGSFHRLLPRLFIDAFVFGHMTIAASGCKLTASGAPKVALVTVDRSSQFARRGCCCCRGGTDRLATTEPSSSTYIITHHHDYWVVSLSTIKPSNSSHNSECFMIYAQLQARFTNHHYCKTL